MSSDNSSTRSHRGFLLGAFLLFAIGLGIRLFRLTNQSFWIDEVSSILAAQSPLNNIYERSALASNSLPTYFILLKAFIGNTTEDLEFRARLLSVIAGALSIPLFAGVVYLWRKQRGTALLAGALLAVNPLHLWYSQEVRGYAVTLLFGIVTLLCFELAREKRRAGWWILYVLFGIIAITGHKTALIFSVACGLWHACDVFNQRDRAKNLLIHLPIAAAALVALMLKSYPPVEGYGRSTTGLEVGYTLLTFIGGYSFGPSLTDIQSFGPLAAVSKHAVEIGIMLLALIALLVSSLGNLRRLLSGKEAQLLCLSVGAVSLYALLTRFPYNVRYALPGLLGFLAMTAVLAMDSKKAVWRRFALGSIFVVSLWADVQWFYGWQYRKADSRAVAQWLVENKERVSSWTVLPDYMKVPLEWYLHPYPEVLSHAMNSTSDRTTTFPPTPDVLMLSRRHHLANPDQLIASYQSATGGASTNLTFSGFELYIANKPTPTAGSPAR
jgi:hypothetical protein